ncbi:hypothetical protein [Geodermatophilus sp. SYSU D01119]
MSRPTPRARAAAFALGAALLTGLTGCEWPDVSMSPDLGARAAESTEAAEPTPEPEAIAEPAAEETATTDEVAAPTPVRPTGDLDAGSLTRVLPAGDRTVVVDYWTTGQATTWTAAEDKTIQIAAHVEGGDDETEVLVTRFAATTDDGSARLLAAEDRGEFALMPPFSYTTALTLTEATPTATSLTVTVQFDLLVETEPGSQRYFRQTVLDTLELPLLQEDPS